MKKKYLLLSFVTSLSILKLDASENFSRRNRQRDWIAKYAEDDEEAKVNLMNKISFTIASCFIDALCEEDTSDVEFAVSQAYNQSSDNIFLPLSENLEQYKDEYFKNCLLNVNLLNILIEG
ncbi:MAG: hypothetical protein CMP11_07370, partial [Zetaproteobacteria bacterium]|nr:hypothetical protein [Pseudobdellovibrionaceae bacterium]